LTGIGMPPYARFTVPYPSDMQFELVS